MVSVKVFDKPGYIDRYTIVIDNDVYSMSDVPLSPQGVNQYWGSKSDLIVQCYKEYGNQVKFKDLPNDVVKTIQTRVKECYND